MPHRVRVVGTPGSGKTRLARRLSHHLDLPYLELDALHHRANWQEAPTAEFRAAVARALTRFESLHGGWIVDGNYEKAEDLVAGADTVVWLDYPRHLVMRRVLQRTLRRLVLRTRLWQGNRERLGALLSRDPDKNIVLWAWTRYPIYRRTYGAAAQVDRSRTWVRLRHPRDVDGWLLDLAPEDAQDRQLG